MKIKSIKKVGRLPVYDISVKDAEHYILENGVVTHNTGIYYSASNIFFIGRQQEKDGTDLAGYNFVINIEKSRFVKEKSSFPLNVTFDRGISKWSGLLDVALETGWVIKPKNGWYQGVNKKTGEIMFDDKSFRAKDTMNSGFWLPLMKEGFSDEIEELYKLKAAGFTSEDYEEEDLEEDFEAIEE